MKFSPYKRSERVAEAVYQVVAESLRNELSDPRLKGVQLTHAAVTDDLQILKIYYYVEGPDRARVEKGLASAKGYLRHAIAKKLDLRLVPDIIFFFDEGIEKAEKLDKLLGSLKEGKE